MAELSTKAYLKKLASQQRFTSFRQLSSYMKQLIRESDSIQSDTMHAIVIYLKDTIKSKYGKKQKGWPANKTNSTPLYKTGELRKSVKAMSTKTKGLVYIDGGHSGGISNEVLAMIHEYGTTSAGRGHHTRIPARPIWETTVQEELPKIEKFLDLALSALLS